MIKRDSVINVLTGTPKIVSVDFPSLNVMVSLVEMIQAPLNNFKIINQL